MNQYEVLARHEADRDGMGAVNNCVGWNHKDNSTTFVYLPTDPEGSLSPETKSVYWNGHKFVWDIVPY